MQVVKCDICKKVIRGEAVRAGVGLWARAELCQKCGLPVLKLLKKYKFLKDKDKVYA